jgi:hypothetical protein
MDTRAIREAVLRRPFQPFTLRMNDGREFRLPHPEFAAVSRRVVVVINDAHPGGVWLEPVLIASIHFDGETPQSAVEGNGGGNP